jgi:hypothetical protein
VKKFLLIAIPVAFFCGVALGVWSGTKAWREGCVVEVNLGARFLKSDCSARRLEGTLVEFVSPTKPLSLAAALKRLAEMTEDKDPQRVFLDPAVMNADFAQAIVSAPAGPQGSLTIIRQLLQDAGASGKVDLCLVQSGYRVQLAQGLQTH